MFIVIDMPGTAEVKAFEPSVGYVEYIHASDDSSVMYGRPEDEMQVVAITWQGITPKNQLKRLTDNAGPWGLHEQEFLSGFV